MTLKTHITVDAYGFPSITFGIGIITPTDQWVMIVSFIYSFLSDIIPSPFIIKEQYLLQYEDASKKQSASLLNIVPDLEGVNSC